MKNREGRSLGQIVGWAGAHPAYSLDPRKLLFPSSIVGNCACAYRILDVGKSPTTSIILYALGGGGLLYILWKVDKISIFKAHLVQ